MVSIPAENPVGFGLQPVVQRLAVPDRRALIGPRPAFDVQQHPRLVGRVERRCRRAPGVEPQVVQSVRFQDAVDPLPGRQVRRRISRVRKDGTFQRAPQHHGPAVQDELGSLGRELPQPESDDALVADPVGGERDGQLVHVRREFVPSLRALAQRIDSADAEHARSRLQSLGERQRCRLMIAAAGRDREFGLSHRGPNACCLRSTRRTLLFFRSGKTWTSSRCTCSGSLRSAMRPTMPFQFVCVWSETLCEFGPTSTCSRLSTRIVRRWGPGVAPVRSNSCGVDKLSPRPHSRSSSQTWVDQ